MSSGPSATVATRRPAHRRPDPAAGNGLSPTVGRQGSGRWRWSDAAWTVGIWLLGAAVFFREQWLSGFHHLMGDEGDTRLMVYLSEHWFRVFHGQVSWRSPTFFYPVHGALGWSDTFFVYQVFYAPLRLLGLDPFVSLQVTIILFSLVGFLSFVYLMRLAFGAPLLVACLGGLVFVFANDQYLHAGRFELNAVYLVPGALLAGLLAWRLAPANRLGSSALAAVAGLSWALLFFSSYYVAWFSSLAAAILVLLWLCASRGRLLGSVADRLRANPGPVLVAVGAFGVGMIPFLLTYWPMRHLGGLSYASVIQGEGRITDLVNVGRGNVWSPLVRQVSGVNVNAGELSYATTPLVAALAVAGGAVGVGRLVRGTAIRVPAARAAALLAGTGVVLAVLPFKTEFATPWAIVWHLPGASALRAIDRLQVVTAALAAAAAVAALTELLAALRARRRPMVWGGVAVAALLLAVVEQVNTAHVSRLDDPAQMALLRSAPAPPASCTSFYVVDSVTPRLPGPVPQIDAMLISQRVSIPTLNGYSGYGPTGWRLNNIYAPSYPSDVRAWAVAHGLQPGLCQLDLGTMTWTHTPL